MITPKLWQNQTQTSIFDRPFNFHVFCYSNVDIKHATAKLQHTINTGSFDNSSNLLETYQSLAVRHYAPLTQTFAKCCLDQRELTHAHNSFSTYTRTESDAVSF